MRDEWQPGFNGVVPPTVEEMLEEIVEISEKGKWAYLFSFTVFLNYWEWIVSTQVNIQYDCSNSLDEE